MLLFSNFKNIHSQKQARASSASYVVANKLSEDGNLQEATNKFVALADVAPQGYAGLSLSRAAGLKVQMGDLLGAVDLLDKSAQSFAQPVHRDLASLKAAYILMELERYDDVHARVATLITENAPYQDLAKELQAHANLKSGNIKDAKSQFSYLANVPGVLDGVKTRAKQTISLLNADLPVSNIREVEASPTPEMEILQPQPAGQKD